MTRPKLDWTIRYNEKGPYLGIPEAGAKCQRMKIEGLDCDRYEDGVDVLRDVESACISGPDADGQWFVGTWPAFSEKDSIFGALAVFAITAGPFSSARTCFAAAKILESAQ